MNEKRWFGNEGILQDETYSFKNNSSGNIPGYDNHQFDSIQSIIFNHRKNDQGKAESKPAAQNTPVVAVAYSFFKDIDLEDTKDPRILANANKSELAAKNALDSLQKLEDQDNSISQTVPNIIKTLNIKGYKYLTATLTWDTTDFEVSPKSPGKQILDTVNGNMWHWTVKAISQKRTSRITIEILAENDAGDAHIQDEPVISVAININKSNAFRKYWLWILNNPKTTIVSIIIPVVAFLFGKRQGKKKKESTEE